MASLDTAPVRRVQETHETTKHNHMIANHKDEQDATTDDMMEKRRIAERWLEHGPDLPPPRLVGTSPTPFVFSTMAQRRLGLTDSLLRRARIHDWAQHGDKAFWAHGSMIEDYIEPKAAEVEKTQTKKSGKQSTTSTYLQFQRKSGNKDTFDKLLETAVSDGTALTSDVRHVEKGAAKLDKVFAKIPLPPTAIYQPSASEVVRDYHKMLAEQEDSIRNNGLGLLSAGDGVTTEEAVLISELKLGKHATNIKKEQLDAGKVRKLRAVWNCYRQPHSVSATRAMKKRGVKQTQAPFSKLEWGNMKVRKAQKLAHLNGNEALPNLLFSPHSQDLLSQVEQEHVDVDGNPDLRPNESLKASLGNKRSLTNPLIEFKKNQPCPMLVGPDTGRHTGTQDEDNDSADEYARRHFKSLAASHNLQLTQAEPLMTSMLAQELLNVQMIKKRELGRADAERDASGNASAQPKFGSKNKTSHEVSGTGGPDLVRTELPSLRKFCASVKLRENKLLKHQRQQSGSKRTTGERELNQCTSSSFLQNAKIGLNPLDIRVLEAEKLTVPFNMLSHLDRRRLEAYTQDSKFAVNLSSANFTNLSKKTTTLENTQHLQSGSSNFVTRIKPGAPALRPPLSVICPPTYGPDGEPTMDISRLMAYSEVLSRNSSRVHMQVNGSSDASTEADEVTKDEQWYGPVYYIKPQ